MVSDLMLQLCNQRHKYVCFYTNNFLNNFSVIHYTNILFKSLGNAIKIVYSWE